MSDTVELLASTLVEDIAEGVYDAHLADIAAACERRATLLDPTEWLSVLTEVSNSVDYLSRQGLPLDERAQEGVRLHMRIKRVLSETTDHPLVREYARTVQRKILVKLLDVDARAAESMVDA